jgi:hypothetical protein
MAACDSGSRSVAGCGWPACQLAADTRESEASRDFLQPDLWGVSGISVTRQTVYQVQSGHHARLLASGRWA